MSESVDLGSPHVRGALRDDTLWVRIDRPERRNAMTQDMYRAVKRAAVRADADPAVAALAITGTSEVFASGGDMAGSGTAGSGTADPGLAAEHDPTDHFPFRHLERCRKPVMAVVNGTCHAGGLNLVLYSDFALASDRASFRVPELLRGVPDPYMAARLADHVGLGNARYLLLTATVVDATEALRMGLVSRVVAHDELDGAAEEVLGQLRRLAPSATAACKADINRPLRQPDVRVLAGAFEGAEMREGLAAFVEKRPPRWPRA